MVSKKGGLVISALGVLSFLFSVAYISSCTKPLTDFPYSCNGIVCNNGGHCDSGKCKCPSGYEGTNCDVKSVDKFFGYWATRSVVIGSDSTKIVGKDTTYTIEIKPTATPTTFYLYSFAGNEYYSELVCLIDSTEKTYFDIDTTSSLNMMYDHYRIRGGYGSQTSKDTIKALVYVRRLNSTVNWQNDTLNLVMSKK